MPHRWAGRCQWLVVRVVQQVPQGTLRRGPLGPRAQRSGIGVIAAMRLARRVAASASSPFFWGAVAAVCASPPCLGWGVGLCPTFQFLFAQHLHVLPNLKRCRHGCRGESHEEAHKAWEGEHCAPLLAVEIQFACAIFIARKPANAGAANGSQFTLFQLWLGGLVKMKISNRWLKSKGFGF